MDGVELLIEINKKHSSLFVSMQDERKRYRGEHSTEIAALKCMDGRINLPVITNTPPGIIQPFRNLGGEFNFGWPHFQDLIRGWIEYSLGRGRRCILLVTYHFARNEKHRGCRGFNYDVEAARSFTSRLRDKFTELHPLRGTVAAIQIGIDTDTDGLILHGDNGEIIDLAELASSVADDELLSILVRIYPELSSKMTQDLLPLISGNIARIAEIKKLNRPPEEADHMEWVLGMGRGFDWLHLPNTALIVGPFSPNLSIPIATAAGIIKSNIDEGRIPKDKKIVLLASAPYRDASERLYMIEKARFFRDFAYETVIKAAPSLKLQLHTLTVTVDMNTRLFDLKEKDDEFEKSA